MRNPGIKEVIRANSVIFMDDVWPRISAWMGGGRLISMELGGGELHSLMDTKCGIDLFQVQVDGVTSLASRVQTLDFESFTIRIGKSPRKSQDVVERLANGNMEGFENYEFCKRLRAIQSKGRFHFPYWTSQAYFPDEIFEAVGVTRTEVIYAKIIERLAGNKNGVFPQYTPSDKQHFWVVPWKILGEDVHVVKASGTGGRGGGSPISLCKLTQSQIDMFGGMGL